MRILYNSPVPCPAGHGTWMAMTIQYAEYWGIDVFPYNGMCIGCGELQWHGSVPPKELRTPGWEGVQRSFGYIPGPRLDFPGLPREYRAQLKVTETYGEK